MPDKISKRSRRIGSPKPSDSTGKKRGRPPKNAPRQDSIPETSLVPSIGDSISNNLLPQTSKTQVQQQPQTNLKPLEYTGLDQVKHGLTFPTFEPNTYFPSDLFSDSSSLERTTKEDADAAIQSIGEKRQTMKVVLANQGLMQDIIKGGMEHRKVEGLAIDYDSLRITNETKFINWQTTGLNRDIAVNKWQQTTEKLTQGQAVLTGMQAITPMITDEWNARVALKRSSINDLKSKALSNSTAMDAKLANTIDNLNSNDYED